MPKEEMRLVIITGLSGAGKTQALRCLEDMGYFCVDNLPPTLVPGLLDIITSSGHSDKVALVMDIRGGKFFAGLNDALLSLENKGYSYQILFLEASDEILIRRFKETRRKHPLAGEGRIIEGILEERKKLEEVQGKASVVIDTSNLSPGELRAKVRELFGKATEGTMAITVMSFGFKYGIPLDADLVLDVRFLPNPFYELHLKELTGHEQEVKDYIFNNPVTQQFMEKFEGLINFLVPYYYEEGKSHLVLAIGCTGGRHRSVALANKIGESLKNVNCMCRVTVKHRDVDR
ncbi:MAG: RNase adapter protein RapZ [Clostridia bacterium]|jgi:UPF0042 nucleotide-binding protein|nr:putative P-loop-containing kinase [Clostridiales bacterium]MDK2985017.1 RNase adapter protein RapZ [Clostridia bacterium]